MAKVDKIRPETIELLREKIDFYLLRGILPVARKWPKKPTPPYTDLQAEAMAVFSIAAHSLRRISKKMLEEWRKGTVGKRPQWPDVYKKLMMNYWKKNRSLAMIALDYDIEENNNKFRIKWKVLQLYLDKNKEEEIYEIQTALIKKEDILKYPKPIYFTLYDNTGTRIVAPYILFELEMK